MLCDCAPSDFVRQGARGESWFLREGVKGIATDQVPALVLHPLLRENGSMTSSVKIGHN